jgi:hypothetical protein
MALDNLNKREKTLAVLTVPLVLIAGWILFSTWWGPLETLRAERDELTAEVDKDERRVRVARKAEDRLEQWHRRSLPSDLKVAASEYHGWLFRLATEAGFEKPDVNVTTSMADRRRKAGAFRTLRFTVRGTGNLEELTEFLFRFESADRLHRIRSATVNPTQGSDELDLSFVVEALSLPDAEAVAVDVAEGSFEASVRVSPDLQREMVYTGKEGKLIDAAKFRLAGFRGVADFDFLKGKSLEEVKTAINGKTETTGVTASVDGDKLYLRCEPIDAEGPAGRLARSDLDAYREAIVARNVFAAYKPPPPVRAPDPEPAPPPQFDPCKFAYVSAIVRGFDGQPEAWVIARTSGQKFELRDGDTFEIGDVQAKMVQVNRRDAEIEFDGKRWLVPLGDNLRDARPLFDQSEEAEEPVTEEEQSEQQEAADEEEQPAEEQATEGEPDQQESEQQPLEPDVSDPEDPDEELAPQDEPDPEHRAQRGQL